MGDFTKAVSDFLDYLPGALIEIDLSKQTIIYMNRMAFFLFDYPQSEVDVGIPLRDIFQNESEFERAKKITESFALENYKNRTPYSRYKKQDLHNFLLKKKDGRGFSGECQGSFVLDDEQVPVGVRLYIRDLTKQRAIEVLLQESEEKYRTLVEFSSDLIFLFNLEGNVLSVNNAAAQLLEEKPEAIQGKNIAELFPKETAVEYKKFLENTLLSGESANYESRLTVGDQTIWFNTSINPVKDGLGKVTAIMGVSRDITESKLAEQELIKLSTAVEQSPASVMITDTDGKIEYLNSKCVEITGYSFDEAIGLNPSVLMCGEQSDDFYKDLWTTISSGGTWVGEFHNKKKNGDLYWESARISPIVDETGEITQYLAIKEDITDRKLAEENLKKSEEQYRTLFNSSPNPILIHDGKRILDANSATLKALGLTRKQELLGQDPFTMVHPEDLKKSVQRVKQLLGDNKISLATEELRIVLPDKRIRSALATPVAIIFDNKPAIMVTYHDITERKDIEDQLRQSQKLETVGTMVGGISHELNNILQSMFLWGGIIQEQLPDDQELQSNFKHLLKDGERAKDIVKQVLTFSRKTSVEMKPQFLHELVMESLILERASLPPSIQIKQDLDMTSGMVLCDETQIHQIVINLCNNAQHAMEERGGVLSISLQSIQASLGNGEPEIDVLELKVSDTGHGIDAHDLDKIFDPFYTTRQLGQGTGLGLSVIHGIITMMGGADYS